MRGREKANKQKKPKEAHSLDLVLFSVYLINVLKYKVIAKGPYFFRVSSSAEVYEVCALGDVGSLCPFMEILAANSTCPKNKKIKPLLSPTLPRTDLTS